MGNRFSIDSSGHSIGKQRLQGLAFIKFHVPRTAGRTQVFRLGLQPADAEVKVFWCGWVRNQAGITASLSHPWGAGWRWDPLSETMTAAGTAELIVRTPAAAQPLFIDLETASTEEFTICDTGGRVLAGFTANGRAVYRLDLALEPRKTHVLELTGSGPFRARGCDWTPTPGTHEAAFVNTNACGDFTLMARQHWFDLRGYPEFDLFSMNLDAVLCVAAHYGGAREEMLTEPMRIYHIEHGSGSGWTPEGQAKLFERIAALGLTFVDNEEVLMWAAQMERLKAPMIFNHEDWGMAGIDLKETVLPA